MNKFLFALLAAVSINASASNEVLHLKANGASDFYTTYQAKDMKQSADNNWMYVVYRGCKKLSAEQVIKQEKLMPNANITGALKCGGNYNRTVIILKDLSRIKDGTAVIVK